MLSFGLDSNNYRWLRIPSVQEAERETLARQDPETDAGVVQ